MLGFELKDYVNVTLTDVSIIVSKDIIVIDED